MMNVSPPLAAFMGGERGHDLISMATLVFGATACDEPGRTTGVFDGLRHTFMAEGDKPKGFRDYPVRRCAATGHLGAPHAMVRIEGQWYLRQYAPQSRGERHA